MSDSHNLPDDIELHAAAAAPQANDEKISRFSEVEEKQEKTSVDVKNGKEILGGEADSSDEEVPVLQRWNEPRINIWRTFVTFLGLFIMGLNDAVYGALLPYLEVYYHQSYTVISLIFLVPFLGYFLSALFNNPIHMRLGQRGIAFLAPGFRVIGYVIISQHPPFPALIVGYFLAGFGNGLEDAAWNAWIGYMHNANELLGFLHGLYGLGGVLSPLIATTMVAKANLQWYTFYYIMVGVAAFELVVAVTAFWKEDGARYRAANPRTTNMEGSRTKEAFRNHITWIVSAFLFVYVSTETTIGGWTVSFMRGVRHAAPFPAGMSVTGFWLGLTVGRVTLGFVTPRIGEKLAIWIYLSIAIALQLLLWLLPNFIVSSVAVALEGFFLGPLFPSAIVATTKLLPKHLHVGSIGAAAALGGAGACILPFATGAIAQAKGVKVLMPILLACLATDLCIWSCLPGWRRVD